MMKKTVVIFPGIGYHADKPLLYYGRKAAAEAGYTDVILISYSYSGGDIRGNREKMREAFDSIYAQAKEQLDRLLPADSDEILFMSKSIGTIAAAAYAKEFGRDNQKIRHVLFTPLEETFMFAPENAAAFIGTEDPWSNVPKVIGMAQEQGIPISVYEGMNHSLERADVMENLKVLQDVIQKTKDFCRG